MNIPAWVQDELNEPAPEGGRNNQMIRIGPALLRVGNTIDEVYDLLCETYPNVSIREIRQICRSAVRLAKLEQPLEDHDRQHLREIEFKCAADLPRILREYVPHLVDYDWSLVKQRLSFIGSLFNHDDVIWIGEKHMSGLKWRRHFQLRDEWLSFLSHETGCYGHFTSHCTFQLGTNSRSNEAVKEQRYWVVESDTLTVGQVLKVLNYLSDEFTLRAIIDTGGKSIHGWFERSTTVTDQEFGAMIKGLQCDPSTLRPSQPVRLPGYMRAETGQPQRLLYLK